MPICFLKKSSSGKKAEAAAEAAKPKASPPKEAEGTIKHIITPGAEYASRDQRLRNTQMFRCNFGDDYYYGAQDQIYYPHHGASHPHAAAAPPYYPGMRWRHMSSSMPPPYPSFDWEMPPTQYSNYPPLLGHYPHAMPQRRYSPAPPPWQFGPGQDFGPPRRQFGQPRPYFGPPRRPFAPPPGYEYYGDY